MELVDFFESATGPGWGLYACPQCAPGYNSGGLSWLEGHAWSAPDD